MNFDQQEKVLHFVPDILLLPTKVKCGCVYVNGNMEGCHVRFRGGKENNQKLRKITLM